MRLIDVYSYCATICKCNRRLCDRNKCPIHNAPTAYDIDKVVKELELHSFELGADTLPAHYVRLNESIKIVKHGGVSNNRKDCEYRHENGNCLKVGGFCTSVDDKHCEKMKRGVVSDDVCEWKLEDEESNLYATGCEQRHLLFYETPKENGYKFCPYCGKKILCKE